MQSSSDNLLLRDEMPWQVPFPREMSGLPILLLVGGDRLGRGWKAHLETSSLWLNSEVAPPPTLPHPSLLSHLFLPSPVCPPPLLLPTPPFPLQDSLILVHSPPPPICPLSLPVIVDISLWKVPSLCFRQKKPHDSYTLALSWPVRRPVK